jgi:hypothetical protein
VDDTALEPRYFLEYPHAALLIFRAGFWIQPDFDRDKIPAKVLDCDYHQLASQNPDPQAPDQLRLWAAIATAGRFYTCVMVLCDLILMVVLWVGYGPGTGLRGGAWLLLLPAALFFTLNRFDVLPALLTAIAFACLGRGWRGASAVALGLGILVKVYPILFVPLVLRYLWPERWAAVRWAMICVATGLLAFAPILSGADLTAILAPYKYQLARTPDFSLSIYGCFLPTAAANGIFGSVFRLGVLGLTMSAVLSRPIPDLGSLLRRAATILFVFVSLAVFYSPQWILWFIPLIAPVLRRNRRLVGTFVGLDLITYATFPVWFWFLSLALVQSLKPVTAFIGYNWNALIPPAPWWVDPEWLAVGAWKGVGGFLRGARFLVIAILILQLNGVRPFGWMRFAAMASFRFVVMRFRSPV